MRKLSTLKSLVVFGLLSVGCVSFIADNGTVNSKPLPSKHRDNVERAINFCPAYPDLIKTKNPDGTEISFYLKGDEFLNWQVTPEGYTLLQNEKGYYCYATTDSKGDLVPSDIVATNAKTKSGVQFKKKLTFSKAQINEALKNREEQIFPSAFKGTKTVYSKGFSSGSRKVLVLLIDFKDRPFAHTRQEYDDMMNLEGYNGTGSFKDYYKAVSYGKLSCETTVKGPYHADGTMAKYGSNIGSNKYINSRLLVQEAVDAAEKDGVNFDDYDNDGDGYVDAVIVVHSNNDEAQGAGLHAIWSHQSALRYSGMQRSYDGVTIDLYNIDPGVTGATGDAMATIGVFCHEFGHALGLPDTYDIDYSGALTPGNWDVMDNGSYNNGSKTPAYHNPWARAKLGWQAPVVIDQPALGLSLADCSTSKDLFRINTQTKGEYYILENRQKTGFNQYVYGQGMLVWHIDSTYISTAGNGVNNDPAHLGVTIVRANNVASNGSANPFPGSANITSFTDETTPSMKAYDGKRVYKPITNIQEAAGIITFDFIQGLPATDAGVTTIVNPKSSLLNANGVNVTAKIKNFGSAAISNFDISYKLDSETPVTETYVSTIAPGAEAEFTFTTQVIISEGDHSIEVFTAAVGDLITENDKATKSISVRNTVFAFPFTEDFEGATFPPASWKVVNPDVPQGVWTQKSAVGINGATKAAFIDYWNYAGSLDQLLTPVIDLKGVTNPTLSFNYAYHKTSSDGLAIQISSDYAETYTTVWQNYGEALATVPSETSFNDFTPSDASHWKSVNIDLSQFIGKEVIVSFTGISANGDNIYIDDVKLAGATCTIPSDAVKFSTTNLTKTSGTINWERGNGVGVVVLQRAFENVDGVLQNGTIYEVGDKIGNSKVIYIGDATSKDLVDLLPASNYNFAIYEISRTKCYSQNPLKGTLTTLGLASVNTITVRDLQSSTATIVAEITSIGEAPVTERGICYSKSAATLGYEFDHVSCQSGLGEFAANLTNLTPASYYYVMAYAKNMYGISYGNVVTFYTVGGSDKLNYLPDGFSVITGGTYSDISSDPNTVAINTSNFDAANSSPIDIGFNFSYNGNTYSQFVLNTNGFIVLGNQNPSKPDLHPKASTAAANCNADGVFFSTNSKDINIISVYNHNLTGGTNPGFSILVSGSAPDRVATIQFKGMVDNLGTASQFSDMNFQIKLYETTNIIEFVYGTFTAHATNADLYTLPVVGLKGYMGQGSQSGLNEQILRIPKSSGTAWNSVYALTGSYTYQSAGAFGTKKSVRPTSGLTYRFVPKLTNDIAVTEVYALTNLPAYAGTPQKVSALIYNNGISNATNVTINLEITGANTYTATPIVIPQIASGSTVRVDFPEFITNLAGSNSVKAFVSAGDMNAANDSKTVTQTVSTNTYSYTVGSTPNNAYLSNGNSVCVKYHINGTRIVKTVTAFIYDNANNNGKSTKAYVYDANGLKIGESDPVTVTKAAWNTFNITTPPTITNSDFYVGIDATVVGGTNYWLAAVQNIAAPIPGVNVLIPVGGGNPTDYPNSTRFMITAVIDAPTVTDAPIVVTNNEVMHPSNSDAVVSGSVTDDKGSAITERGFYWSTSTPVTLSDNKIASSTKSVGEISETITGLTAGNTYYVRAFASNAIGTNMGNEISFVKKMSQTITFGSLSAMAYEDADVALTATASSSLPVSYFSDNTNVATIVETPVGSGNFYIHVVGVGSCNIKASQSGNSSYGAAADVIQPLLINKKTVAVTIPNLNRTFNYNPHTVSPIPANFDYTIKYNGSSYAPVDAASYTVIATINDANYQGTATETLVINKENSTITFNPISVKSTSDEDFFPDVISSSGLDISLASDNPSVATVVNGLIHIVGTGTTTITASSTSNGNFNAPEPKNQVLTVKANQVITFNASSKKFGCADFEAGSVNSGLALSYLSSRSDVATIVNGKIHIVGIGHTTITATQAGDATWAPVEKSYILIVDKGDQAITMDNMNKTYGDVDFNPATTNSGLSIAYTSDNLNVATILNGNIHIVGAGTANITATQSGNSNYNAANPVTKNLTVVKAPATISITNITATYDGNSKSVTATTTPAGLTINVTYEGATTAPTNAGSYAVVATIDDANYQGTQNATLTISKASATIEITNIAATYDGTAKSVTTTTTPAGLTVNVTYDGAATAPINAGSYAVVATINDANYQGTQNATLTISKASATIEITNITATYDGTAKSVTATTTPAGLTVNVTYEGAATAPINAGSYAVVATINDANYQGTQNATLTINKAAATITFGNTTQPFDGSAKPVTTTTDPTGLTVVVKYTGTSVNYPESTTAPSAAGTYSVTATIDDANYAGTNTSTLTITPGTGVDPVEISTAKIYSDSKTIYVELPEIRSSAKIIIYNIIGNQVYLNENPIQGVNRIDENLMVGNYIVKVIVDQKIKTEKVVITK